MRLHPDVLATLPPDVDRPRYDRGALATGIVHLGIGAFHRAHQAAYTDDTLARAPGPWAITGVSWSPSIRDALSPQEGLYTLAARDADHTRLRVIGSITEILVSNEEPEAVLERLCRPSVRVVSLTVTEKGYCHDPATGELNEDHPGIRHDLAEPRRPETAPAFLAEALHRRRREGTAPFTVLSCDNLPQNGETVAGLLRRFAELREPGFGQWVRDHVSCPNTMVDRITPATTDEDKQEVTRQLGVEDAWPVVTEPFRQWVIEDRFPTGRPAWEAEGAQLVDEVRPYELMKLRLLNGSHSSLAYLGYLTGYQTIAEAVGDPAFAKFTRRLMDEEVTPTLEIPPGADIVSYKAALMQRFANPALGHRTWQIAMDGSQKLPQRLLGPIRDRLAHGAPILRLSYGVAGWMRYVTGRDERDQPIDVQDPMAGRLAGIAAEAGPVASRLAPALLEVHEVFGDDLPRNDTFVHAVTEALERLYALGARRAADALP